jgi:beta-N-acetylhexosaminidase
MIESAIPFTGREWAASPNVGSMRNSGWSRRKLLGGLGSVTAAAALGACANKTELATPGGAVSAPESPVPAPVSDEAVLRQKIASLLVAGFRGERVGPQDWIVRAIRDQGLGGVILFDRDQTTGGTRNITSPEQVTALVRSLKEASPGRLIVSIDQEGGRIARLNPGNGFPATLSQAEVGSANDPALTRRWAEGMAQTLRGIGVNVNFTPVVDLAVNPNNPAVARLGRAFSADPDVVVECATEEIRAFRAAGVRTSVKHFPGLGSATGNTDFEVVDVSGSWTPAEIEPFQRLIDNGSTDMVMVAHFLNRQLDPARPVSLSKAVVTDLLRGQLGWQGPVVTDDMQAVAIKSFGDRNEAVALAIEAGVDLITLCNQETYDPEVVESTVSSLVGMVRSGRITEARIDQSVARVDTIRPT